MLIATTESIAGQQTTKTLGIVVGYGFPSAFTTGVERQREESWDKARHAMLSEARALGANAIVAVRMEWHSSVVVAYGTAVTIEAAETTT